MILSDWLLAGAGAAAIVCGAGLLADRRTTLAVVLGALAVLIGAGMALIVAVHLLRA